MKSGRQTAALFTTILVAASLCASPVMANPGCSVSDIGQAVKDTFTNIPASCAPQAADPGFYPLLGYIVSIQSTPEGVAFCNTAESANASASDIAGAWKGVPASVKDLFGDIGSAGSAATSALNVASCACKTAQWKGPGDLAGDFSACLGDALCSIDDWLNKNVWSGFASCDDGTPPHKPTLVDCRPDPKFLKHDPNWGYYWDWNDSIPYVGAGNNCDSGYGDNGYSCQGNFCLGYGKGNDYCFCPQVMQHSDQFGDVNGNCIGYLSCHCPIGSQPLSSDPMQWASYVCICPDTGLGVNADGSCPPPPPKCEPSCPAGQVTKISDKKSCTYACDCPDGLTKVGDKCVTPCADASQVMLAGGACCAGSQATSCGTCCPAGMKPDGGGQSCVSALPILQQLPQQQKL